ncbi:MAG: OmpA family protein [Myxococcota bacterium]
MKRLHHLWLPLAALALAACGNELEEENARLQDELSQLSQDHQQAESRLAELQRENEELRKRVEAMGLSQEDLEEQLEEVRQREAAQRARLESFRKMLAQFRKLIEAGKLKVKIVRGKMIVELPEGVLFDSGKAELKSEGEETLKQVAEVLAEIPDREYLVAGHTDNVPIRSRRYPSNWELSAARGVNVAKYLADHGLSEDRIAAAGYADTEPVASNDSEEGRAQNRRIEIVLMPNVEELPDLSELEAELEDEG